MIRWLSLGWLLAAACSTTPTLVGEPVVADALAASDVQVRIVRLQHVQAEVLEEILIDVLGPRGPGIGALKVTTKADENAVVLSGPPEQLREALDLIARLDSESAR